MNREEKQNAISHAIYKGGQERLGYPSIRASAVAVFDYLESEGYRIEKTPKPTPVIQHRQDDRVTNDDGIRFFRGLMYAAILSVPLWAIIGAVVYLIYSLIQRFI